MPARSFDWGLLVVSAVGFLFAIFSGRAGSWTGAFYESIGLRALRMPDQFYRVSFLLGGSALGVVALLAFLAPLWR